MITVTFVEAQNKSGRSWTQRNASQSSSRVTDGPLAYMTSPQDMKEFQEARARSGQGRSARDWATASAQAWNEFDAKFGSFADEHSTL
jgi:antitoxin Phd